MSIFTDTRPTLDNYWRAVILFGQNVASYKFALGQALLELTDREHTFITLEELAEPFSRHLIEHLKSGKKQITSKSSRFPDAGHRKVGRGSCCIMGQGLGLVSISEARASACVSIYSLMCATLPSRMVMSKTHSSLYGLFVA